MTARTLIEVLSDPALEYTSTLAVFAHKINGAFDIDSIARIGDATGTDGVQDGAEFYGNNMHIIDSRNKETDGDIHHYIAWAEKHLEETNDDTEAPTTIVAL